MRADAGITKLAQNGHSANFYFAVPMVEHPAASDGDAVENRQGVKRVRVVGVHFDFFGHVLLFDKDAAANRPRALHIGGRFDRNHFDARRFFHDRLTSAAKGNASNHLELKRGLCYASANRGDRDATIVRDGIGA